MKKNSKQKLLSLLQTKTFIVCCLFLFGSLNVFAQKMQISGTVTDETGETLIGTSVKNAQTNLVVITDINGKYTIEANTGNVLEFSYIGMAPQKITVGTNNKIDMQMVEDNQLLKEVVVIGYGRAKKRDLTGSIATVKGSEIANKPMTNPTALMQGKVAGVQVINSGQAGAEPDIRIRGTNSINGAKPLYIVDGLFNDNINFLNPADVESMEVLKDPSSLAIFGVRGANGVIIITTKQAKVGITTVTVNSSVGAKQVVDRIKLTNAAQFKELYNEQLINQGVKTPYDYTNWQADTDWQDQIYQVGLVSQNNVSISGAGEKNKFYLSAGYIYEEGMIKHENLDKISLSINDEYKVTKDLKFGFQFNGYKANPTDGKGGSVGNAVKAAPIAPIFNEEYQLYNTMPEFQRAQVGNPMVDVELKQNTSLPVEYRAVGNVFGELDFLKNFNFRVALSADYGFNQGRSYGPIVVVYNPEVTTALPVDSLSKKTSVNQNQNIYTKIQTDYLLTYKNQINDHGITATAGFTSYYNSYSGINASRNQGEGDPIPNDPRFWYITMGDAATSTNGGGQWETATMSMLMRALYNYKSKYLLNASFRRDGTSAFLGDHKWQNFGAVGAAWIMTEENFMANQDFLNFLKIKGSWGILGNQNTGEQYPAFPNLNASSSAVFGNNIIPGYTPSYLPDPNLHWETVHAWEAGFEANFINNRLHFEANYYSKLTKDLITSVPGIGGASPGKSNLGEIENKGIELSATWNGQLSKDWTYSFSGNFTTIDNMVKSLSTTGYAIISGPSRVTAGYPIGYFFGYKSAGVYQTYAEIKQSPVSKIGTVLPGDLKYADTDNNGEITEADRTMIGNPTPDLMYGFSFNLGFKNVDFAIDMMGVYGNEIYRAWNQNNYAQFNYQIERMGRWHGEGTSNWEPILSTARSGNYANSDYFIEDGSFFRIRNIQLGYNLSKNVLNNIGLKGLRLYVNAQNPITFKNSTGYSPEIGGSAINFGVDNGTYPMPAVYSFGFNLSF